jgi:hypothetical protein
VAREQEDGVSSQSKNRLMDRPVTAPERLAFLDLGLTELVETFRRTLRERIHGTGVTELAERLYGGRANVCVCNSEYPDERLHCADVTQFTQRLSGARADVYVSNSEHDRRLG